MKRLATPEGSGLVLGLTLLFLVLVPLKAPAHPRSDFYARWWQVDLTPEWHFDSNVPNTNVRDRIKDGSHEWNNVSAPMSFDWQAGDLNSVGYSDCPDDASNSGVHWRDIDGAGGVLGETRSCLYGGTNDSIKTFQIKFDDQENWYTGTGTPGSSELDLWSDATHEFGHATGFGLGNAPNVHFTESSLCDQTPKHTMCASLSAGSTYWRSLEAHDIHTFQNRYP